MSKFMELIADFIRRLVRPLVTIMFAAAVVFLVVTGAPVADWFIALVGSIIAWWFADRNNKKDNNGGSE